MRNRWSETLKGTIRPIIFKLVMAGAPKFTCPICGYTGPFKSKKTARLPGQVREHAKCVRCGSAERHRILALAIEKLFGGTPHAGQAFLHVAPEFCLQPLIRKLFPVYHSMDLFRTDVDFRDDIQKMSFSDASYDVVLVARVLTNVPDYHAAVREVRRVLKPGGVAIFSEAYPQMVTEELQSKEGNRRRKMGLDLLGLLRQHFSRVDALKSEQFEPKHQVINRIREHGVIKKTGPEELQVPDGYQELVAVCYA